MDITVYDTFRKMSRKVLGYNLVMFIVNKSKGPTYGRVFHFEKVSPLNVYLQCIYNVEATLKWICSLPIHIYIYTEDHSSEVLVHLWSRMKDLSTWQHQNTNLEPNALSPCMPTTQRIHL